MIAKLWRGDYGLAKTFWLWGVLVTIILQLLLKYLSGVAAITMSLLALIYAVLWSVSMWRAANKYTGRRLWPILAKVVVILNIVGFLAVIAFVGAFLVGLAGLPH